MGINLHRLARQTNDVTAGDEGCDTAAGATIHSELLPSADAPPLAAARRQVTVARIALAPGGELPAEADDPTSGVFVVEIGTIVVMLDQAWVISRRDLAGPDHLGAGRALVAAGAAATLGAGDSLHLPAHASGMIRNAGPDDAIGVVITLTPRATTAARCA